MSKPISNSKTGHNSCTESKKHKYDNTVRLIALKLYYTTSFSINRIIEITQISIRTLFNWRQRYSSINITKMTTVDELNKVDSLILAKPKLSSLTAPIKEFILKNVINVPSFRVLKLINNLEEQFKIRISKSTLYRWLKIMKISYKKAKKKVIIDKAKFESHRTELKKNIEKCLNNKTQIISIDEFAIHLEMYPNKGWSPKGTPVEFPVKKIRHERYSVLMAINRNNIVNYIVKKGSIDNNIFGNFITNIIKNKHNYALLMDNARIHHSKFCQKIYKENSIETLFNIPYNSDTNPIEYCINKIKSSLKRSVCTNNEELFHFLEESVKTVKQTDLRNFFKKSIENLSKIIE